MSTECVYPVVFYQSHKWTNVLLFLREIQIDLKNIVTNDKENSFVEEKFNE